MAITGTKTISISQADPLYWVTQIVITAPDPNGKVRASVTLRAYTEDEYGTKTFLPYTPIMLNVSDVLNDSTLEATIENVLAAVATKASQQGLI